jgi:two-component system, chemotaxis family, CheB/CheR fusion protein
MDDKPRRGKRRRPIAGSAAKPAAQGRRRRHAPASRHGGVAIPIVGIGASAGGLDALKAFLGAMPADSGMAFVIVQHLDPAHESHMADILAKITTMRVVQARNGAAVAPNTVYTNPPGRILSIRGGRLVLGEPAGHGHVDAAIDRFLVSLAEAEGSPPICIILSGSGGSDGLRGVRAVRTAGGMCMAQDPRSAAFPAMPQAAIDTGLADIVLPPAQMPAALMEFVRHPLIGSAGPGAAPAEATASDIEAILTILRSRTGGDFTHYKRPMVIRRIQRRMGLRQASGAAAYLKLLQKDSREVALLARDMLIGVSSFFRDAAAFEALNREVVVPLVHSRPDGTPLRAWIAGCATGEEAYSVAMLLLEAREAAGHANPVQVFATDVDELALKTARAGAYPLSVADDMPAARLEAFFTRQGASYQVTKLLREAVVFSRHNLLADPPFSKLDLVCCRNVLIYLEPAAQRKVLSLFGFALKVGGHLLLGKSEGVAGMADTLTPVSKADHLYRLTQPCRRAAGEFPLCAVERGPGAADRGRSPDDASVLAQVNLDAVVQHFGASVVLIDPQGTILHFHGQTEKYLGHPKGPARLNLLDMAGGAISARLRRAISRALHQEESIRLPQVALPHRRSVLSDLTVIRVHGPAAGQILAVIFEDSERSSRTAPAPPVAAQEEPLVAELEGEVKALRAELAASVESSDLAAEELRSANEEVMSMNEELQSTNEELEASKEELQSFNEELNTVNSQLNEKVRELTEATGDLANLLGATEIATVFLDARLKIRRFTPRATALLNVIDSDLGRPVGHITHRFAGIDLAAAAAEVLASLTPAESDQQTRDGQWYTVCVLPYRTLDNRVDGVVITFSDVTRLKLAEQHLRVAKTYAERVIETVRQPLLVLDRSLKVLSANRAFGAAFQVESAHAAGLLVYDLAGGQWAPPEFRALLGKVIPKGAGFEGYRLEHVFGQAGRKVLLISGQKVEPCGDMPERLLLTFDDITERERSREDLERLNAELEQRVTQRTAQAELRAQQLRELAARLGRAEQTERERFARLLHDDLQQVLVGTRFHLEALRSSVPNGPSRKEAAAAVKLLAQALTMTKSLTAQLMPPVLFDAGLDAALPGLASQMQALHKLNVKMEIHTAVPLDAEGVAVLLFGAVRELLLNVAKHARIGSAQVQLDRDDADHVRIVVSDQGCGFSPATFNTAGAGHLGFGLFDIKQRLEYVGGRCDIDSAPGRGTRVTLTARVGSPREPVSVAPMAPIRQGSPAEPDRAQERGDRIRVLLVDDHAVVRKKLADILNKEPDIAVVAEACDGLQAIEQARRHLPDVIIMDVSMPRMSGIDATRAIRAERPAANVIAFSMYQEVDRAKAMREAGAVGYVNKGGPLEELLSVIRACVSARNDGCEPAGTTSGAAKSPGEHHGSRSG